MAKQTTRPATPFCQTHARVPRSAGGFLHQHDDGSDKQEGQREKIKFLPSEPKRIKKKPYNSVLPSIARKWVNNAPMVQESLLRLS